MASEAVPPVEDIGWQDEYDSLDTLREQVAFWFDQISQRLDDIVRDHTEVRIEADDDEAEVLLICEQQDDAPTLEPTGGAWGTSPLERVHDVFVDSVQSAGRRLQLRHSVREARSRNRLVAVAPLAPNPLSDRD